MIRNTFFLLLLSIFSTSLFAEGNKSDIQDVTVYLNNAKVTRIAEVIVQPGQNEIVLTELTPNLMQQTIQVKVNGSATMLSATYRKNYLSNDQAPSKILALKQELKTLQKNLDWNKNQQGVYTSEIKILDQNQKLGSNEEGMSVDALKQLTAFYRQQMLEIKKTLFDLQSESEELIAQKNKVQLQLNELNALKARPIGEIVVQAVANVRSTVKLEFSYVTTGAGWSPLYDLRSPEIGENVKLVYKANIWQNTGYDWNKVNLKVSTGNPNQNNSRPILNPLYVNFYNASYNGYSIVSDKNKGVYKESAKRDIARAANMAYEAEEMDEDDGAFAPEYTVAVNNSQVTTEYEINLKQSIPSDRKSHLVKMQDYDLNTVYQYHSVPKLDQGAFLLAKVADWGKYQLLGGTANIFFEDMYVGQSIINPRVTSDTLLISMGRDEGIQIQRNTLNEFCSKKLIGTNRKETFAFEISVRNNKNKDVSLEIVDQIPISKNKEIEVSLDDQGGANYLKDYGKLSWDIKLKPGETKKIRFTYTVKYPKNKSVSGVQ